MKKNVNTQENATDVMFEMQVIETTPTDATIEVLKDESMNFEITTLERTPTEAEKVLSLVKRIEELESQLTQEPQSFEERMQYYKRKKELTERYEAFIFQINNISELQDKITEHNQSAKDFTTGREHYRLSLLTPSNYRDESILDISNPELLNEVLELIKSRMQNIADSLQVEIAQ